MSTLLERLFGISDDIWYAKGQEQANQDIKKGDRSLAELRNEWARSQNGDPYDRGYIHTLNDHERKTNGSV